MSLHFLTSVSLQPFFVIWCILSILHYLHKNLWAKVPVLHPLKVLWLHEKCMSIILSQLCIHNRWFVFADSASKTLSDQYRRELSVKETVVENVALTNDRNLLMRYKLTWWCQPYISESTESLLEANLVATGLRK